ncbi:hypothetical protein ACFE04_015262 [Oxalis oulophora]
MFGTTISISISISNTTKCLDKACSISPRAHSYFQELDHNRRKREEIDQFTIRESGLSFARKLLGGPGSSPPRCVSKCGKCTPCKPVHVLVPPGTPVTAEYYPEAWRCKCGNRLYMP